MNDIFFRNIVLDHITGDFMNIVPIPNSQEEFEDTKGVIRRSISKKNRQGNGQKKKVQKDKQRSIKHTYKTKDRVTRTPLQTGREIKWTLILYHTVHHTAFSQLFRNASGWYNRNVCG